MRRLIVLLLLTMGAASAQAMRFSFDVVDPAGREVDGAEVCATRAATAGVAHWLGDEQVRCYPATTVIAFPPGLWAVYAVKHGRYVSTHPYFIPVKGDPADTDTGFKKIQIPVTEAVSVQLPSGAVDSRVVLYFPSTASWMTFSTPIPAGQAAATVPRDAAFLAFLVSAGQVTQIARPRWAADRSSAAVTFEPAPKVSVLAAVRHSRLTGELAPARELPPPALFLTTGDGTKFESRLSYRTMGDGDLALFEDVPSGTRDAVLHVAGATYERVEEPFRMDPASGPVVGHVVAGPTVTVTPAAELRVSLSTEAADFLRGAVADCGAAVTSDRVAQWTVVLDGCGGTTGCHKLERRGIDALLANGEVRYEAVTVGAYELAVVNPRATAIWREKVVARAGTSPVVLSPPLSRVVGRVTRAGAPVHAQVAVANGTTTTAADGTYSVTFAAGQEPAQVDVLTCEAEPEPYTFFPQSPLTNMATFNIELPEPVTVRVEEAGTRTAIPAARLSVNIADRSPQSRVRTQSGPVTDGEGRALLRNPPSGREYLVCARATDYEEACGPPADGKLTLALTKVPMEDGRIEGVAGVQNGMLYFITASGETTEATAVAADGAFRFRRLHGPQEYALFISRNQPLAAMPVPPAGAARLTLPRGRVRSLTIRSSGAEDYEVGLALGDLVIPSAVLSRHQAYRGASTYTQGGQLVLREFIESARTVVYRGYSLTNRPPTIPIQVDVFTRPELRRTLVARPADGDVVSFD